MIATAVAAVTLLGAFTIYALTDKGQLVIETNDPQVEAVVRQNTIRIHDGAGKRSYDLRVGSLRIPSGDYTISVTEESGLKIETQEFRVERNGTTTIRAWLKPSTAQPAEVPLLATLTVYSPNPCG